MFLNAIYQFLLVLSFKFYFSHSYVCSFVRKCFHPVYYIPVHAGGKKKVAVKTEEYEVEDIVGHKKEKGLVSILVSFSVNSFN